MPDLFDHQDAQAIPATREITLSNGSIAIVDADDYALVSCYTWQMNQHGYAIAYAGGGRKNPLRVFMHRLIANTPRGMVTDHKDGNRLNNRRANLRICSQRSNTHNREPNKKGHSSRFKGVLWFTTPRHKTGYWKAQLASKHLGYFKTEEDAARAYDKKARELFGEFAWLNFPDEATQIYTHVAVKGAAGVTSPLESLISRKAA